MALQFLCCVFLLLHLQNSILISATTSVVFYTDDACQDIDIIVQTDTKAGNGDCGVANGTNSASPNFIDHGCYGIKHL